MSLEDEDNDPVTLRILGPDAASVEAAREELDLIEKLFTVDIDKVEYVKGYKFANIDNFKDKSGVKLLFLRIEQGEL